MLQRMRSESLGNVVQIHNFVVVVVVVLLLFSISCNKNKGGKAQLVEKLTENPCAYWRGFDSHL